MTAATFAIDTARRLRPRSRRATAELGIVTDRPARSPLNRHVGSMAEVDALAEAWLATDGVDDTDDPEFLAALPEAPESVLEAARAAFTANASTAIAELYAGHCQPRRIEIDDYDADGFGGLLVPWPADSCGSLNGLSAALYEGGAQ